MRNHSLAEQLSACKLLQRAGGNLPFCACCHLTKLEGGLGASDPASSLLPISAPDLSPVVGMRMGVPRPTGATIGATSAVERYARRWQG